MKTNVRLRELSQPRTSQRRQRMKENIMVDSSDATAATLRDATKNQNSTTEKKRSKSMLREQDTNAPLSHPKSKRLKLPKNEKYKQKCSAATQMPSPPPLPDVENSDVEKKDEEEREQSAPSNRIIMDNGQKKQLKRPLNAYFLFAAEIRDQVRAANPDLTGSQIVSLAVCFAHCWVVIAYRLIGFAAYCLVFTHSLDV